MVKSEILLLRFSYFIADLSKGLFINKLVNMNSVLYRKEYKPNFRKFAENWPLHVIICLTVSELPSLL